MADTKGSALSTQTALADGDLIPHIDVSDTTFGAGGTNKTITKANLKTDIVTSAAVTAAGGYISGGTDVSVTDGGTGSSTAAGARTNLGLVIGTDVLAPTGSAASLTSFPTLNQNTSGSAATLTTSRNIDGQAFNGSTDITVIAPGTHAATSKVTPVDADEVPLVDSAASNVLKKVTWANLKATLKTYFDTLYQSTLGYTAENTANKDTDSTFAANSDTKYPSQKAVKTAVDGKQPLDSDLTTIAGLTATTDTFLQSKASAWATRTPTQVTADLITMVGDSGSGGTKGLVPAPTTGAATKYLRGDATWQTISGGGDALTSGNLGQFASTTSAQLATVMSDETGTNKLVFSDTPTLVTPILGTPTSATLTNATGLPVSGITPSTVTALGVGSVELGHATDTTLSRSSAGVLAVEGVVVPTISSTSVLTNKDLTSGTNTFPTLNQNTTGSAATLTTTRTIWGQNFNGSANVTGDITLSTNSITMTGSIAATGSRVTKGWFTDIESTNAPTVGGTALPTASSTTTFTNKRVTKRTGTTTSSATPTINTDNVDFYSLTAQTVDITSFTTNLSGTPTEGQTLWIAITGTAARAISWGTSFEASTVTLPTTTVTTNRLDVGFVWNTVSNKWRCVATC